MIPGLAQWVKDPGIAMSCGVGCRRGLDPALLWFWCRPVATAPIRPLAWNLHIAAGVAQEKAKRQKKKKEKRKKKFTRRTLRGVTEFAGDREELVWKISSYQKTF